MLVDGAGMKKVLKLNMLGDTDMKKPFSLKMVNWAGIKKAPFSQYVRRDRHKKDLFC